MVHRLVIIDVLFPLVGWLIKGVETTPLTTGRWWCRWYPREGPKPLFTIRTQVSTSRSTQDHEVINSIMESIGSIVDFRHEPLADSGLINQIKPVSSNGSWTNGSWTGEDQLKILPQEHHACVTHLVAGGPCGQNHAEWLLSGDVAGAAPWMKWRSGGKTGENPRKCGKNGWKSENMWEKSRRT